MVNRRKAIVEIPDGFVSGEELNVSVWRMGQLVIDTAGHVRCYLGYRRKDQRHDLDYYAPSVALHDRDGRSSYRFVELRSGMIRRSGLPRKDEHCRLLSESYLALPRGADSYFGVVSVDKQQEELERTRQIFGGTSEDI